MESNRGRGQGSLWTVAPTEEEEEDNCSFQDIDIELFLK
jgi:hypothetical protein